MRLAVDWRTYTRVQFVPPKQLHTAASQVIDATLDLQLTALHLERAVVGSTCTDFYTSRCDICKITAPAFCRMGSLCLRVEVCSDSLNGCI